MKPWLTQMGVKCFQVESLVETTLGGGTAWSEDSAKCHTDTAHSTRDGHSPEQYHKA